MDDPRIPGPPCAAVDLDALAANLARLRRAAGSRKLLAVVKANAYGHGLVACARRLIASGADGLAVARLAEAVRLRDAGITGRVVVLGGCMDPAELPAFGAYRLEPVVQVPEQVEWIERAPREVRLHVWLEVDTGMHRLGVRPSEVRALRDRLLACPRVAAPPVLMTHLANADDLADRFTAVQLRRFETSVADLRGERSVANSGGLLGFPATAGDWVRPGIALYGISPFLTGVGEELGLRPVMTLTTRLVSVKEVPAGTPVGYGGTWCCPEPMRLGVAAIGYGDGYPRDAPTGTPVQVGGARAGVVGRVSMDLLTIDLRAAADAAVGSVVTLWGGGLAVEEVARAIGRSPYELVAGLGARVGYHWS